MAKYALTFPRGMWVCQGFTLSLSKAKGATVEDAAEGAPAEAPASDAIPASEIVTLLLKMESVEGVLAMHSPPTMPEVGRFQT